MRVSNPTMRVLADQMEREEVSRWAASLARARVTRWGGMISTPDDVLQVRGYEIPGTSGRGARHNVQPRRRTAGTQTLYCVNVVTGP